MSIRVYGNRPLKTLSGQATRPTSSRVRESTFNIWRDRVEGCRWLDLCAGVGSMGAEALCRGAAEVVGIERSPQAYRVVQENWNHLVGKAQHFEVFKGDVRRILAKLEKSQAFDCIYFDPPYDSELYVPILSLVEQFKLLAADGELAAEHAVRQTLPESIGRLQVCDHREYGHTGLTFYCWNPEHPLGNSPSKLCHCLF